MKTGIPVRILTLSFAAVFSLILARPQAQAAGLADDMLDAALFSVSQGNLQKAKEQMNRGLAATPGHPTLTQAMLELAMAIGDTKLAEKTLANFEKANKNKTIPPGLLAAKADLLIKKNQIDKAFLLFEEVLKKDPNNVQALMRTSSALAIKGDLDGAFTRISKVIQLTPQNTEALYNQGMILISAGKLEEATIPLKQALLANPRFSLAYKALADVYHALGNALEAKARSFESPAPAQP